MFHVLIAMLEQMQKAAMELVEAAFHDPRDGAMTLMSAAAVLAGVQAGHAMAVGDLHDEDREAAEGVVLQNFRHGIQLGLEHGLRVGAQIGGGRA